MMTKIKKELILNKESYLIILGAIIHFLFFFLFEFKKINVPNPDMEIAGLTIVFRMFIFIAALYFGFKLKDIADDNRALSIGLFVIALVAIIPSADRVTNFVPVIIWLLVSVYIIIKYKVFSKK